MNWRFDFRIQDKLSTALGSVTVEISTQSEADPEDVMDALRLLSRHPEWLDERKERDR